MNIFLVALIVGVVAILSYYVGYYRGYREWLEIIEIYKGVIRSDDEIIETYRETIAEMDRFHREIVGQYREFIDDTTGGLLGYRGDSTSKYIQ